MQVIVPKRYEAHCIAVRVGNRLRSAKTEIISNSANGVGIVTRIGLTNTFSMKQVAKVFTSILTFWLAFGFNLPIRKETTRVCVRTKLLWRTGSRGMG